MLTENLTCVGWLRRLASCSIWHKKIWNINLGTGSQLVYSSNEELDGFEERAFFDNQNIQCISHLPAGRSLNLFADLLRNIRDEKDNSFFWNKVKINFNKKNINIII